MNFKFPLCTILVIPVFLSALFWPAAIYAQDTVAGLVCNGDSTRRQVIINLQPIPGIPCAHPRATGTDSWFADDKIRHLLASMISTSLLTQSGQRAINWNEQKAKIIGAGTTFSLGLVKEVYDSRKTGNHFCWKDLAADTAGILLGLVISGIK